MNRRNLKTLADHLYNLPSDYKHFDMAHFHNAITPCRVTSAKHIVKACPIGHIPRVLTDEFTSYLGGRSDRVYTTWVDLAEFIFDLDSAWEVYEYMFGAEWVNFDNTPKGAAQRIYRVLIDFEGMCNCDISRNDYDLTGCYIEEAQNMILGYSSLTPDSVDA